MSSSFALTSEYDLLQYLIKTTVEIIRAKSPLSVWTFFLTTRVFALTELLPRHAKVCLQVTFSLNPINAKLILLPTTSFPLFHLLNLFLGFS